MTNDEGNYGIDDASVVSDADVVVASAMSGRSEAKSWSIVLKHFILNQKVKLVKVHMVMECSY